MTTSPWIGSMPNLKVLRVWGLPTNEKEELIKMLPHLKSCFERKKGCTMPKNHEQQEMGCQ